MLKDKQVIAVEQVGIGKFPLYCEKWEDGLSFAQDWFIRTKQIHRVYITLEDGRKYMIQTPR